MSSFSHQLNLCVPCDATLYLHGSSVADAAGSMKNLRGKVAIVTGAAHGIGKAIAERLVDEGCKVVWADVDEEAAGQAAAYCPPGCEQGVHFEVGCCF